MVRWEILSLFTVVFIKRACIICSIPCSDLGSGMVGVDNWEWPGKRLAVPPVGCIWTASWAFVEQALGGAGWGVLSR